MTCSNETYTSRLILPAQTRRWRRLAIVTAMIVMVEAFQEALEMRRAAQKTYLLNDE